MSFAVVWMQQAKKKLQKLETGTIISIVKKVEEAKDNPHHFLERLTGIPLYKLRVGDYRVIVDLKENEKRLEVLTVGHRREVYKRM